MIKLDNKYLERYYAFLSNNRKKIGEHKLKPECNSENDRNNNFLDNRNDIISNKIKRRGQSKIKSQQIDLSFSSTEQKSFLEKGRHSLYISSKGQSLIEKVNVIMSPFKEDSNLEECPVEKSKENKNSILMCSDVSPISISRFNTIRGC